MAGADSSAKQLDPNDRRPPAASSAHTDATEAFQRELYAAAGHGEKKTIGSSADSRGQNEKPKHQPTPAEAAATRSRLARDEYHMIIEDAAAIAYDPSNFSNLNKLEHLYDNRIRTNRDAVAYSAQALKFTGDPYNALMLDETSFPDQAARVGIQLAYPTDGDRAHGADNKPVAPTALQTIDKIDPDSPAAKAGLQKGDQITYVDSISMRGRSPEEIATILSGVAGTEVDVTVMRNGQQMTVEMTRPAPHAEPVDSPDGKTGKLGIEYGLLGDDGKHLRAEIPPGTQTNAKGAASEAQPNDVVISNIIPNSAAEQAGLKRGDVIRMVNGHKIAGETFEQIGRELRGNVGEAVDLHVMRQGKPLDIHAVRGEAKAIQNITAKDLGNGIEYIKVGAFSANTAQELRQAMEANARAKGIILDLRGNPGGLVDEAVKTAELMMKTGPLYTMRERVNSDPANPMFGSETVSITEQNRVTEKGRDGEQAHVYNDAREQPYLLNGRPLLILQNQNSASASEIVTGALHDDHVATTLGEKSYGKGVGQLQQEGSDSKNHYKLKVTNFRYFTPSGFWPGDANKNRIGIEPDIKVPDNLPAGDPQLDAGMDWMKKHVK